MVKNTPEFRLGNVFIRPNLLTEKGDVLNGHEHNFDHVTYIVRGKVHITCTSKEGTVTEKDFSAGDFCLILATSLHEITALEDDTLFHCIYSHRDAQGRVTEDWTGWTTAYGLKFTPKE